MREAIASVVTPRRSPLTRALVGGHLGGGVVYGMFTCSCERWWGCKLDA